MENLPDYAKCSLDELDDVYRHIDRERYPDRFKALTEEIEKKKREPAEKKNLELPEKADAETAQELPLSFHGSGREYFRIWIVNLCLTLLTLGIFSAWAKVRKKRYFFSCTTLDGTAFQYLGQPIPILKGRVVAVVAFLLYYLSSNFLTSLLPYVAVAALVIAPWIVIRTVAFNARYASFRNLTFHFDGRYVEALKVLYVWGFIPVLIAGMLFVSQENLKWFIPIPVIAALGYPWWICRLRRFIVTHTAYGSQKGSFSATGWQFFKVYFKAGLVALLFVVVMGVCSALLIPLIMPTSSVPSAGFLFLISVPLYVGYVLVYAYVQAHSGNLTWNHIRVGPVTFRSTLRGRDLATLYLTNALAIIFSLGLMTPWAVVRTLQYRARQLHVRNEGDLAEFQGAEGEGVVAAGAEMGDFFDMDFSL